MILSDRWGETSAKFSRFSSRSRTFLRRAVKYFAGETLVNRFQCVADFQRRYGVKRLCSILGIWVDAKVCGVVRGPDQTRVHVLDSGGIGVFRSELVVDRYEDDFELLHPVKHFPDEAAVVTQDYSATVREVEAPVAALGRQISSETAGVPGGPGIRCSAAPISPPRASSSAESRCSAMAVRSEEFMDGRIANGMTSVNSASAGASSGSKCGKGRARGPGGAW